MLETNTQTNQPVDPTLAIAKETIASPENQESTFGELAATFLIPTINREPELQSIETIEIPRYDESENIIESQKLSISGKELEERHRIYIHEANQNSEADLPPNSVISMNLDKEGQLSFEDMISGAPDDIYQESENEAVAFLDQKLQEFFGYHHAGLLEENNGEIENSSSGFELE